MSAVEANDLIIKVLIGLTALTGSATLFFNALAKLRERVLQVKIEGLEALLVIANQTIDRQRGQIDALRVENTGYQKTILERDIKIASQEGLIAKISLELAAMQTANTALTERLAAAEKQNGILQEQIKTINQKLDDLQKSKDALQESKDAIITDKK